MTMTEVPELAPFALLREVARTEGIRELIEARRDQVALAGWDIVPDAGTARAMQGDLMVQRAFKTHRAETIMFLRNVDPDYASFTAWLRQIAEDLLVIDAVAVKLRKTRGGDPYSLDLLDAATVEPWPDAYGRAAGTRQYLSEIPRRTFAEIAASPVPGCTVAATYQPGEIQYLNMTVRRFTPFGYSPLEAALVRDGDARIDLTATAEHLRQTADDHWAAACRDWLRTGLFAYVLEHFGDDLRWEWEA